MARPFRLGDLLLVWRLQRRGVWLDPADALTGAGSPAWAALGSQLLWRGRGLVTSVSRAAGGGVVQTRLRPGRKEAQLSFLAPVPEATEEARQLWLRLLGQAVRQAGEWRVQRLFACAPDGAEELLSLLRQVGFAPFTREEVYRLEAPDALAVGPGSPRVRAMAAADEWALQRVYAAITPRLVQQAEGGGPSQMGGQSTDRRMLATGQRLVLLRGGEVSGLMVGRTGKAGRCLALWGHFEDDDEVLALLCRGASPPFSGGRPVYCVVREYQGGVRAPLAEGGFRYLATWTCLVKHTVARVARPAWRAWTALETSPEVSAPTACGEV